MQYEVLRPFECAGVQLQPGTIVDVSTWRPRCVEGLISDRRLRPVNMPAGFDVKLERRSGKTAPLFREKT